MNLPQGKWIDKYLSRYGPASIFGAFILAYFYWKRREFGFSADLHLDKIGQATVFLFGGFLIAYLASAPVLVCHFGRCLYLSKKFEKKARVITYVLMAVSIGLSAFMLIRAGLDAGLAIWTSCAISMWVLVATLSTIAFYRRDDLYQFYQQLSAKRKLESNSEFIESYRTLREHGNAFLIIYWELMLALIAVAGLKLYDVTDFGSAVVFVLFACLVWVTPAVLAWGVAGHLETDFVDDNS
ncbi:MAG: hypothetical protein PHE83_10480 [Opitutaceae bacterium]|nr:hypothetical protein [Opitutaceae bacterium]